MCFNFGRKAPELLEFVNYTIRPSARSKPLGFQVVFICLRHLCLHDVSRLNTMVAIEKNAAVDLGRIPARPADCPILVDLIDDHIDGPADLLSE